MAVTFDGPNLTITLESGVTDLAWIDVYSDWKRWVTSSDGHKYAPAFRTVGGDPLSAVIDAGAYFFLRNDLGWRIKPPEEDITIFVTGNLALESLDAASILPTTGNFTAAVLGLQPITQGVVPSMKTNLEFNSFQGAVCLDMVNATGRAVAGTGYDATGTTRVGTRVTPVNNPDDALTIANREGLHIIQIVSNFDSTGYSTDFSEGFEFQGDSPFTTFNMQAAANYTNCAVTGLEIMGETDGVNLLRNCRVKDVTAFSGTMYNCTLDGDIDINGKAAILDCYSDREGLGYSRITGIGANVVIVRNMRGSLGLADMTGGIHSLGFGGGGRLVIEATCIGGTAYARGDPYEIADSGSATVIDQTGSQKLTYVHNRMGLGRGIPVVNNVDGSFAFDGITVPASIDGSGNVTHSRPA